MIDCVSDEPDLQVRYVELAKAILSESGSKNIVHLFIDIEVREGFFLVSADLREKMRNSKIGDHGQVTASPEGAIFNLEPSQESRLPLIMRTLRKRFDRDEVFERSRYELLIQRGDADLIGSIDIDEPDAAIVESTMATLEFLSPEGFRISRTMISGTRMTLLCSQYGLKDRWVQRMVDVHNK